MDNGGEMEVALYICIVPLHVAASNIDVRLRIDMHARALRGRTRISINPLKFVHH